MELRALLQRLLSERCVQQLSKVDSAGEAIALLAAKLSVLVGIDAGVIERATLDRERASTTAFANGAAIPHCRLPGLRRFAVAVLILQQPVRWDLLGHAVDTVVMIVGPTDQVADHLRIIANTSQLLDSRAVRAKLRAAPDAAGVLAVIAAAESAVEQRRSEQGVLREVRKESSPPRQDFLAETMRQFGW